MLSTTIAATNLQPTDAFKIMVQEGHVYFGFTFYTCLAATVIAVIAAISCHSEARG